MPSTITVDGAGDDAGDGAALAAFAVSSGGVAVFSSTGQVAVDSAGDGAGDAAVFVPILPTVVILFGLNNVGVALARQRRAYIYKYGVSVTVGGTPYRMQTQPDPVAPGALLPSGVLNAAAADLRLFTAAPADFPVPMASGTALVWEGVSYTVLLSTYQEMSAVPNRLKIRTYRTPQADIATAETTAEAVASGIPANAGLRKEYLPAKPPF